MNSRILGKVTGIISTSAIALLFLGSFVSLAHATITSLTLTDPAGGEEWRGIQNITWDSTTDINGGNNISILLSTNSGGSYTTLVSSISSALGTYPWDTTQSGAGLLADGSTYRIKLADPMTLLDSASTANFTDDNTVPATSLATTTGTFGLNGYYNGPAVPTFDLNCTDSLSGCLDTSYQINGGGFSTYGTTFALPQGINTLQWFSRDQAVDSGGSRNTEATNSQVIKVDTIDPTVAVTSTTADGAYNAPDTINVTLTFSEAVTTTDTITVTLETGATDRTCVVPIMANASVGTCTYTVQAGDTTGDLTTNSIAAKTGFVLDVAGNTANLTPSSNLAITSAIVIDTTAPDAFTTGLVVTDGGTVVATWWNSTNTGASVEVPFAADSSLTGGTMQLQAEADGTFENIGSAYEIFGGYLGFSAAFPITDSQIEAIAGFSEGDNLQFRAILTDIAGNATTGTQSVVSLGVDQTTPSVDAGTDKEVNIATLQNAIVTDGGSGISTYLWVKDSGLGTITFTPSATSEDTTISASTDGIYGISLTVVDIAGNSNSDDITFVWDTTAPTIVLSSGTPDPTNGFIFVVAQFSETVTGFVSTDIAVSNGVVDSFVAVDGDTYNFNVDPADGASVAVTIDVPMTTSVDAAGNANTASNQITRTSDTVAPAVSSITTTDANLDGEVDTATIVFTEAMKDSTFNFADFTIGGIPATNFSTGITENDDTVVLSHAGVAGTNTKTVAYVPGTAITDLAGNIRVAFTSGSIDEAKPVLLSARTVTTTSIDAQFSEDLNGATVNVGGAEFTVAGFAVGAAVEHVSDDGRVVLTVATMPTDATPLVTYTQVDTLSDLAPVPNTAKTPVAVTAVDGVAPVLSAVSISSNNDGDLAAPEWAKTGDVVTLTFTSSETIAAPTVLIQGVAATSVTNIGNNWTATRTMTVTDTPQGTLGFSIAFADVAVPTPNTGTTVTATGDDSTVFFDRTAPSVNAGIDKEVNAVVSQNATVSDDAPSSGILSYSWTNQTPGVGVVTFGSATAEDTTISADTDGTYTIRLTVSDNDGNSALDEITFIWDTTNPEPLTASPSDGSTGVAIAAGTATVTYDEDIVLMDATRVLFVNDATSASYKGTVVVSGGNGASAILNIPYSGLDYGTKYRINVKPNALEDVAGNNLATNFISYFTTVIDTAVPVANSLSAGSITTTGAVLSVTTDESATCKFATTDSAYSGMTAFDAPNTGTSHAATLTGLTPTTGYDYFVRCADTTAQTNTMTTSAHVSFTTLTPDTAGPVISNIQATSIGETGATITWNTDENATSLVEYGLTSSYGNFSAVDATADNTAHSVSLSSLSDGTDYHFRVISEDASANSSTSGDNVFTTVTVVDATAPAIPVITTSPATIDADTYTIAGTVVNDGGTRVVSLYNGATLAGTASIPTGDTVWSILVPLTQDASNVFTATADDEAGNTSGASASVPITEATATGDTDDPAVPVISGSDETVDADTYTLSGTAGADAPTDGSRTITIYRNSVTTVVGSIVLPTGETAWSFVAPLLQGTTNTFTAYSTDEAGNTSTVSNSRVITEATALDATAPVIVLLGVNPQTLTVGDTYTELGATASDDIDGDISGSIVIDDSAVNMAVAGTYTVAYDVSDTAGNTATQETRTVIVEAAFDDTASLAVTGIDAVKTYAIADDTYDNGWSWTFNVTVPTNETQFQVKFADFVSGGNTITAANNIRFYSAQASGNATSATAVEIIAANTYSSAITLDSDLAPATAGRQIEVTVEIKVPTGSVGGSYSAQYGVQSNPI